MSLDPGTIIDGKYEIEGRIGAGGMGIVYRARQLRLLRSVAIKVVSADDAEREDMLDRFRREALAVARLRHPNIVTIHDFGDADGVGAYIVLELLEGRSLAEEILRRTRLEPDSAIEIAGQICAALGAAHAAGIVHRDLKPSNVFLEDGKHGVTAKVLDFGIAKLREAGGVALDRLTWGGAIVGTPIYMSPEQCEGRELDARSDIYSLGCVLFEMLAGRPPFVAASLASVVRMHKSRPPEPRARSRRAFPRRSTRWSCACSRNGLATDTRRSGTWRMLSRSRRPSRRHIGWRAAHESRRRRVDVDRRNECRIDRERQYGRHHARERWKADTAEQPPKRGDELRRPSERARRAHDTVARDAAAHALGTGRGRQDAPCAPARAFGFRAGRRRRLVCGPLDHDGRGARTPDRSVGARVARGGRALHTETLVTALRDERTLMVLDGCEHLVGAVSVLASMLLGACGDLRILATSRETLGVAGEVVWSVPTLGVSEGGVGAADSDAVRLFVDRVRLRDHGFAVTSHNADVIVRICRRLDGIPLAIELAAARARVLSLDQILEKLGDRFRLLTGGDRAALPRRQTLKATLDWSYALLSDDERHLFERLSVFSGGCTLDAAEGVVRKG
jgi:non-specific serine/threonine protein kinase